MTKLLEIKTSSPNYTQKQIAKEMGYSDSTIERYRNDIFVDGLSN